MTLPSTRHELDMPEKLRSRSSSSFTRGTYRLPLLFFLALGGCAQIDRNEHADSLARPAGLVREQIATEGFVLTAWSRIYRPDQTINLYIEGDGLAWLNTREPSPDPTPRAATGLALAAADAASNVVYLARPCQFTPMDMNPRCSIASWTGRRFSPDIVASMNEAIDRIIKRTPGQQINLIGYSGGAAIAVLVAAQRYDVASIRTVAGNLDSEYINRTHGVSAMPESLNPIDFATRVANIPQMHFNSGADTVVTPEVAQRFVAAENSRCAHVQTIPGIAHDGDWQRRWPELLASIPCCSDR
ncbi:MAG TPA: hypothetical protein VL550_08470 [Rhodocyclaceae bacterium]|nr:hypothetical protein [Rhodocyclaceae bacterium]